MLPYVMDVMRTKPGTVWVPITGLARPVQLGIQPSRHFGRAKTKFQLCLAAIVANLALLTDKISLIGDPGPGLPAFHPMLPMLASKNPQSAH